MANKQKIYPFWRYYGGKYRAASHYPKPKYDIIIEPFAGAAGYSTRHYEKDVILIEKYELIADMWQFLIDSSKDDILSIPLVESIYDLPKNIPQGARTLVGFSLNDATVAPVNVLSAGKRRMALLGRNFEGWNSNKRKRIADQVDLINHWTVVCSDYSILGSGIKATWFVDPPYNNKAGSLYVHNKIDYRQLANWCLNLTGQVIVCENEGADWLPFMPFRESRSAMGRSNSKEVIFYRE